MANSFNCSSILTVAMPPERWQDLQAKSRDTCEIVAEPSSVNWEMAFGSMAHMWARISPVCLSASPTALLTIWGIWQSMHSTICHLPFSYVKPLPRFHSWTRPMLQFG